MTDYTNAQIIAVGIFVAAILLGGLAWEIIKVMAVLKYLAS